MNLLKKDATVSHTIYPNDNRAIYLNDNPISDQVVIGLAKHLKDATVSQTLHLHSNQIGDEDAIGLAKHLKDATVSQTLHLHSNQIGDEGAIGLTKHLKDATVSHTIHLAGNEFGGVIDLIELKDTRLENVLKNAKVSHTISVAEMIDKYTYGYIGEKEQKDIMLWVGIGVLSPAPMTTIGVMALVDAGEVFRSYLDIEQNTGKIAGGILGFAGAYTVDMLWGIVSVAGYGLEYPYTQEHAKKNNKINIVEPTTNEIDQTPQYFDL